MRVWDVTEYGTRSDGVTNDAPAIQKAIDDCAAAGGGRVLVPAGRYLCGTIELKNDVELHLSRGASLMASLNKEDIRITPCPDGAEEDSGYFIGALHAKGVSITGDGEIYGQGYKVMRDDGADGEWHECPLMVDGFRPRLTYFEDVEDLRIQNVTFRDSALWTLHMAGCRRVKVQGIQILNHRRGANNDGIDPDSCQDVVISDCMIETGDDAIVVKTTKPMTERYGPCENILIRDCILASHDSALKIGTETHGDIRNIIMSDCIVRDCSRGIGIWVRDGGTVENIQVHHIMGAVRRYANSGGRSFAPDWWGKGDPIFLSATFRKGSSGPIGKIRNVYFDHIRMDAESSIFLRGEKESNIQNVYFQDVEITMKKQGTQEAGYFDEQPSERGVYAHEIPAIYAQCARDLSFQNMKIHWTKDRHASWTSGIQTVDCQNIRVEGMAESVEEPLR